MCKYDATKGVADVSSIEIAQRRALRCMLTLLLGSVVFHPTAARADHSGTVFVDANANGWLDAGEVGRADVVVSNGRDVVRTDAVERWGDYFASVAASGSGGALEVRASRADGSVEVARLSD